MEMGTAAACVAALHDNFDQGPRFTDIRGSVSMERHEFVFASTEQKRALQTAGTHDWSLQQKSIDSRSEFAEEETERVFILTAVRTSTEAMEFLPAAVRRGREVVIALLTDKHSRRAFPVKQQLSMRDECKDGLRSQESTRLASKEEPPDVVRIIMAPQRLSLERMEAVFRQD